MNHLSEIWVYICAIAFVNGHREPEATQLPQLSNEMVLTEGGNSLVHAADDSSRADASSTKGDYGMFRLGRGLQMLRLGKRSTNVDSLNPDQATSHLSSNDVQAVLASIFDQPRDESRRQPPLPRYGRDSSNNIKGRLLDDAVSDGSDIYQADFFPFSNQRFFFRPAPRGGRYRRSLPMERLVYGDYVSQDGLDRVRALAFPRFEQFIEDITHLRPKAVPRPRIGRYQNDQTVNSFQNKLM